MDIREFQRLIERIYFEKDSARGLDGTFRWFAEEVGELARALRHDDRARCAEEFADVLAWLSTMASICGVDLEEAARKYANGCPKCRSAPCQCLE
ncbi:MAG TPA: MazG nucleotide pyrophosphohydrolase domain-containing protein [Armatimonadota bacterium]|nr:MazG nucleotide pyrophosphohydrolase domain-containing protein [Armatimonadota bacterium]